MNAALADRENNRITGRYERLEAQVDTLPPAKRSAGILEAHRGIIAAARRNGLPRCHGRIQLPPGALGSVCDDPNPAVRGAADVIASSAAPPAMKEAAAITIGAVVAVLSQKSRGSHGGPVHGRH